MYEGKVFMISWFFNLLTYKEYISEGTTVLEKRKGKKNYLISSPSNTAVVSTIFDDTTVMIKKQQTITAWDTRK